MTDSMALTNTIISLGIASMLSAGLFGAFGAIVHYLFLIVKEKESFTKEKLFFFVIMGSFVGVVVNEATIALLQDSYPGLVLASGFLFLKILEFLNANGIEIALNKIGYNKES